MKTLIPILIGLLVVGCGKKEQPNVGKPAPTTNANKGNGTEAKPVKELTAEEKVVGEYEIKEDGTTVRVVFLEDGIREGYINDEKFIVAKWKIVDGEIHEEGNGGMNGIYILNKNGSITEIAVIDALGWVDGKRIEYPKENQLTFKKIK